VLTNAKNFVRHYTPNRFTLYVILIDFSHRNEVQIGFTFLVPAHLGSPEKKGC